MRNHWVAAIAALTLLGGCNSADHGAATQQAASAVAQATTITGTVTFQDAIPVAPGSKLHVELVDVAHPQVALAEKDFDVGGEPPFTFALDFDPARIDPARTYIINTVLTDGPRRFMPALISPVLTNGSGTAITITLKAEATPAEKLADACTSVEKHIGGLKKVEGTYTTEDSSVGWDAFAKNGVVRYVRVNTVMDAGGSSSVNYAYDDGKPMCVKQPGGEKAKWSVGWDPSGAVLFNVGADGSELSEAEISARKEGALKALRLAQAKVDASRKK